MVYTTVKSALTSCPSVSAHFFDNMEVSPGSPWPPSPLGVRLQHVILYSGKLSREKTFCEFPSFVAIHKSFLCKIWGVAFFGAAKVSHPRKFSQRKSYFHQFTKIFSLENFLLYGSYRLCKLLDKTVVRYQRNGTKC